MSDFATLLAGIFRANAAYELVLFDRLAPPEREILGAVRDDPDYYGLLRPRPGTASLSVKAVDRETALLFLTLSTPAPLPGYVMNLFGADAGRSVARLVADGILQVDAGDGFVCGADAASLLASNAGAREGGRIASLSQDALRYAQALPTEDVSTLAGRIYGYNRLPLTPRWRRLLSPAAEHARFLGTASAGAAARALSAWSQLPPSPGWLSWTARSNSLQLTHGPTYKLYVSPTLDALAGGGFAMVVSALTSTRAAQFKVGAGAAGLLRPDKIVAYFTDFGALAEGASRAEERLAGMPAHGVPFTAEIGGNGLLSWGVDPPRAAGLPWMGAESWRVWLARRLAHAIISARGTPEPWRFAVERVRLERVDTDTWTPGSSLFSET